jgi:hypothetical protein
MMQRAGANNSDFIQENLKLRSEIDTLTKMAHNKTEKMTNYQKEIDSLSIELKRLTSERKQTEKQLKDAKLESTTLRLRVQ